jgi:hypothetical protein
MKQSQSSSHFFIVHGTILLIHSLCHMTQLPNYCCWLVHPKCPQHLPRKCSLGYYAAHYKHVHASSRQKMGAFRVHKPIAMRSGDCFSQQRLCTLYWPDYKMRFPCFNFRTCEWRKIHKKKALQWFLWKQTYGSYDIHYVKIHMFLKYCTHINLFQRQQLLHCCYYHETHLKLVQYHISGAVALLLRYIT